MPKGVPYFLGVYVQIPEGLVADDVPHLLQASGKVFSQRSHGHALDFPVHYDRASSQALQTHKLAGILKLNFRQSAQDR